MNFKKNAKKKLCAVFICAASLFSAGGYACADGEENNGQSEIAASVQAAQAQCSGEYCCLMEASTGTVIGQKNGGKTFSMGHFAKLMTVYLAAQKIETGEISLDTETVVSKNANAQNGTQIWLDVGEKITVEELVKSITIGNANDACYALGEALCKNETEYISLANQTAVSLGMENTHFADITGMNTQTVSTAEDIAVLCCEILRYDYLNEYFCTWMDDVRNGKTQLVNTNRLVRSYNGIAGLKACYNEASGNCLAAAAKRDEMTLVCVAADCTDEDSRFEDGKNLLDFGFSSYEIYIPEIPSEAVEKIKITNGAKTKARVEVSQMSPVLIPKGTSGNITAVFEREQSLAAPVKKGQTAGEIKLVDAQGTVFQSEISVCENIEKMSMGLALKRLWLNLLNIG